MPIALSPVDNFVNNLKGRLKMFRQLTAHNNINY